jgi:hypothetical protein
LLVTLYKNNVINTSNELTLALIAAMYQSHQLNRGAKYVHMAYQRNRRGAAEAGAEARAASGVPAPCKACDGGGHHAHTYCGACKKTGQPRPPPRAAPGAAAATSARLGTSDSHQGELAPCRIIQKGDSYPFFDAEGVRANARAARDVEAAARDAATAARDAAATARDAAAAPTLMSMARAAVVKLLTTPVKLLYRKAWFRHDADASADVATAADLAFDDDGGGDDESAAAAAANARAFDRLLAGAKNVPPAAVAALREMKDSLNRTGPLADWARRGYEYVLEPPLRWDENGAPLEPEPQDWAAAKRRVYLLNLSKTRAPLLEDGEVQCVLCRGPTRSRKYSLSLCDRSGIVPIVENDAAFGYMAAMQRQCLSTGAHRAPTSPRARSYPRATSLLR